MKKRVLQIFIYVTGIICLYAFISLRMLPMFNSALVETMHPEYFEFTKYGEQYYKSYIKHFREELPTPIDKYRLSDRNPKINDADIIALGDSYFDFSRQKTVPERLQDSLNVKVHAIRGYFPLDYLHDHHFKKGRSRTIIFEVIERDIHDHLKNPHLDNETWNDPNNYSKNKLRYFRIRDNIFLSNSEELYDVLLKGSYLTSGIYSIISTFKFDAFKYMPDITSAYSLTAFDFPVLFWGETVADTTTSFYYNHTDERINTYCDNIADLSQKLKEKYNLDMVFCPVPSKYTMWHKKIDPDAVYDNFLPRLYKELEKRNIPHIDIYHEFLNSEKILYFGTDSHWNKDGVDIAVNKLLLYLRNSDQPVTTNKDLVTLD